MRTIVVTLAAISAAGVLATGLAVSGASAAPLRQDSTDVSQRISEYSIQITPRIVKAGKRLSVEVSGVYSARQCSVTLLQDRKKAKGKLKVRSYTAKGRVTVPRTFKGSTVARVACGKDGTATSAPFMVVGPTEPTSASCDVLEHGFSVSRIGYAEIGMKVRNSSPTLSAEDVEIALTYRDSSGRVVKTDTIYHYDGIPPATTIILAGSTETETAASVSVNARCDTALEEADPVLPSGASIVQSEYSIDVVGEMRNTLSRTIERLSEVNYLVRNSRGAIIGGGTTYLDSFVSPGAIGTWDDYVYGGLPYTVADGVEANVFVDFED